MAKKFLTPVGLPSGTANPASAAAGELFYRSDINAIYMYTGTEWAPQAGAETVTNILVEFGLLEGDSGTPETASFSSSISGGTPATEDFITNYEGGEPDSTY
jgi:hypothetical protein